jgi:hypothetical protein
MMPKRRKREPLGLKETTVIRCASHLTWLRGCSCVIEKRNGHVCSGKIEAAHVRCGTDGGISMKPSDIFALPLCAEAHREQHQIGEPAFERRYEIDMRELAESHAAKSPHRKKWMDWS